MRRSLLPFFTCIALAATAQAHFLFVVPEPGGGLARVILSEDLDPDEAVKPAMAGGARLFLRDSDGFVHPLTQTSAEESMLVELPGTGTRVVFGSMDVGVHQVGDKPGNLVTYYTKTILGDPFDSSSIVGDANPVELTPVRGSGGLRFQFTFRGEPVAGADVTVFLPDGSRKSSATGEAGTTELFAQAGRYGAWAKTVVGGAGELDGQSYAESRGYATLVAQFDEVTPVLERRHYAPLPQATSSFGAVESEGWLYVYGGHTARTHDYDTEAVSGRFYRMNLAEGSTWQSLPSGPALQGMNLAAHQGSVYRVGGMQPRNPRGTKPDNFSMADCVRFNGESKQWEWLAPMPEGRSSHDLAVIGNTLYVIGGWNMLGRAAGNEFLDSMLTLDLADPRAGWKRVPQPFSRRALIVSVLNDRIYVMGGIDEEDEVSREVNIFDTKTFEWTKGPELIGDAGYVGFASAACTLDGRVYASVAGGDLLRLTEDGSAWEFVQKHEPRIVHRLIPWRSRILVSGGAESGANLDLIEAISPAATGARGVAPAGGTKTPLHHKVPDAPQESVSAKPVEAKTHGVPAASQMHCPVMTNVEVAGDEDATVVTYAGREVLLCCSKCVKKWETDPTAYLLPEFLPQIAGMELPARTIEQVNCPVFPSRVVSENDPFVMYKGVKVYLFNKTAVRRWNEDPEKYANPALLPQLSAQ